jgi:hypothetical protein
MSINGTIWSSGGWDSNDATKPFHRPVIRIPPAAGLRQRLASITATLTTKTPLTSAVMITVRDGEPGLGTILWGGVLACFAAGDGDIVDERFDDVNPIFSSLGGPLTIEYGDLSILTGANDYCTLAVTGVTTADGPPADMWHLSVVGPSSAIEQPGVAGKRLAATYVSYYLRSPPTSAGSEITQGIGLDGVPLAQTGKGKPLWGAYNPRPSSKWGVRSYAKEFRAPILGEVGGPIVARADVTDTGGFMAINVWGRTLAVGAVI